MANKLAYHANCWGALGGDAVGVTSITQLTYRTFGNMEKAINDIASAGYQGTEIFDANLMDYASGNFKGLKSILKSAGIKLVAAYSGANFIFDDILAEELAKFERVAAAAAECGAEHFVVGGGAKRAKGTKRDDIKKLGAALEKVVKIATRNDLKAHYHPHLSTIVEGPKAVRKIFKETSIDFCPDTAHLAAAGGDVPAMIQEHAKRISYVHLKGWQEKPFAFTPLDEGSLDIGAVVEALKGIKFNGWITAELDSWPDPKDGAIHSLKFMQNAGL